MWPVVAAYGGERYLHQVAVPCASKVLVCATEVTSNIVFNCYLCLCSLPLYIEKEQKRMAIRGDLCQTNNKHVQDGGIRRNLGWGIWL
jgi:hypothetical protein